MALTVGVDSYVTVEWALEFADSNGITLPVGGATEVFLRRATRTIDRLYAGKWIGSKTDPEQALAWPRNAEVDAFGNLLDPNDIPIEVREAVVILAPMILAETELYTPPTAPVVSESVTAGPVTTSTTYASPQKGNWATTTSEMNEIATILKPLLTESIVINQSAQLFRVR